MSFVVVLGLGSNLGARRALLGGAVALLDGLSGCQVLARSPLYVTPPLGPPQPDYLNAAVRVAWDSDLAKLLAETQRIEAALGRTRDVHWGPRTIDIDILWSSGGPLRAPSLEVPHPGLTSRPFALAPLLDVAPELGAVFAAPLAALGGTPSRAEPSWPTITASGPCTLATPWLSEPTELAALIPALVARIALPPVRATHMLPLSGPLELVDDLGECWLEAATQTARERGFVVVRAVITRADPDGLRGVLIGEAGLPIRERTPVVVTVERRDDRQARALVSGGASDRGFDFLESFTM